VRVIWQRCWWVYLGSASSYASSTLAVSSESASAVSASPQLPASRYEIYTLHFLFKCFCELSLKNCVRICLKCSSEICRNSFRSIHPSVRRKFFRFERITAEEIEFEIGHFLSQLMVLPSVALILDWSYGIQSCITRRPLTTYHISFKSETVCGPMGGHWVHSGRSRHKYLSGWKSLSSPIQTTCWCVPFGKSIVCNAFLFDEPFEQLVCTGTRSDGPYNSWILNTM